jgi:transcriptional regulator with GAF, ATPase, and Fis domain
LSGPEPVAASTAGTLEEVERERILQALQESGGVIGGCHGAAARLGLKRTTLLSKMQRLGITRNTNYSSTSKAPGKEGPEPIKP